MTGADLRGPDADAVPPVLEPAEVIALPPGAWCAPWPGDAGGDGRAGRLARIRSKNAAFAAWDRAALLCEQRRHSAGEIPAAWLDRLRELEAAYRAAVEAVEAVATEN